MVRDFLSLTEKEVKQIVTDIFNPKDIRNVEIDKLYDEIRCDICTEWTDGETVDEIYDTICLRNPFNYGSDSIEADFSILTQDYEMLKQFCFAKGIYGSSIEWLIDNPYMKK